MSRRRRKRIAAATLMLAAVFGLGLAGYIQATRASGRDGASEYGFRNGTGYRLNHQRGSGGEYQWYGISNRYAHTYEDESAQPANNAAPGSNEPENSTDEQEVAAADTGTTNAYGAGSGGSAFGDQPSGGARGQGGDGSYDAPTLRLAGNYMNNYGGGGFGAGGGGGRGNSDAPPSNNQTGDEQPSGSTNPPGNTQPTDTKPADTKPTDEGKPGSTEPNTPPGDKPIVTEDPPKNEDPGEPKPDYPTHDPKPVSVPEPATLGLFGLGIAAMGFMRRRRVQAS